MSDRPLENRPWLVPWRIGVAVLCIGTACLLPIVFGLAAAVVPLFVLALAIIGLSLLFSLEPERPQFSLWLLFRLVTYFGLAFWVANALIHFPSPSD